MTSINITLWMPKEPAIVLRSIAQSDIEKLRVWKNDHRYAFFHQDTIEPEQQQRWFEGYRVRAEDFMFMVQFQGSDVGCMGFRILREQGEIYADIYNVILAQLEHRGTRLMSKAMGLMNAFITSRFDAAITARVLRSNPAVRWYASNGFDIAESFEDYFLMKLDRQRCGDTADYCFSSQEG